MGQALLGSLGATYSQQVHLLGHSLGALVNASAANYLHGDRTALQEVSPTSWSASRTHVTLFDEAELSSLFNRDAFYDGLTVSLLGPLATTIVYATEALQNWKPAMPIQSAWADNYVSLIGLYQPEAVNIALQKAEGLVGPIDAHSYPMDWYDMAVINPLGSTLGFQRSFEYRQVAGLPGSTFPPSDTDFPPGVSYHQAPYASDPLILEPLALPDAFVFQKFGVLPDVVVQGEVRWLQGAGNVLVDINNTAQQAGALISQGFNYVGNLAAQGSEALVNLFDSAVLRLTLSTSPSPSLAPRLQAASPSSPRKHGPESPTSSPAMAWLTVQIPTNATGMAFDFIAAGNPVDDVLVCGIGETNLLSLQAKYIPTNTISASRLIDLSAWAGMTNELFFGLMGGTSTNATLQIENIRFYSLRPPRLDVQIAGGNLVLMWPASAGGYVVETTPTLALPGWEMITNVPEVSANHYALTHMLTNHTRFFRLRQR